MVKRSPDYYPSYSRPERIADLTMHILGVCLGTIAALQLIWLVSARADFAATASVLVYCFSVMASLVASLMYHFTPFEAWRPVFRRFDHAAIFLKIAGTYTPLVVLIGGNFNYGVLALVWILAIGGMIWKVFFWEDPNWKSTLLYLALGWISIALAWPIVKIVPWEASGLMATGGIIYTLGVIFYRWDDLRYSVAIWHAFVLVASGCLYTAILWATLGG